MTKILAELNPLKDAASLREHGCMYGMVKHATRGALYGALGGVAYALASSENIETAAEVGATIGLYLDTLQIATRQIQGGVDMG
jgi:hypothetical protein